MLRIASNSISKGVARAAPRSFPRVTPHIGFHASSRKEEESKAVEPVSKGGLFGTGLSEWFALPVGITAAVPLIKYEWLVVNEETQLLAVFIAFCVTFYTQGGDAVYKAMDETAKTILKEHTEAEDKVIAAMEKKLEFLKANSNMVDDFEAINKIREEAYVNLNKAGKVKPQHDFKAQMEKAIAIIVQEEQNVAEKAKTALMEEATAAVTAEFGSSKELQKAALDSAIAKIKGTAKAGEDPVQATFIQFFKNKAADAAKSDDGSEAAAQRAALVHKLNATAKNEGFFFQLDANGQPKMVV
mmetsp:Transcript_28856/g.42584  ORF Transcript_28856/g.42584 Transcript_28856/m.42584 type:complete len:300 (+) Transcript_28856:70-969(+)|eukprot:CAMPEP_0194199558 /NCGR_PEP_ID=MMETSP0156-20130528/536_1 /TAXON_ID=33649 /ORGANISM="Thalassionema nitzschioides, Strain L26-B" /LENGTH=299 /DNA_ID=CAMNT_0038924475 /DNA_START=32 /DNA_END=931 /DNA_ORIENTATION=+